MAKNISLKLDEDIFLETEKIVNRLKIPRNRYLNVAIDSFNKMNEKKALKERLRFEIKRGAKHSMEILKEFEALED